MNNEGMTDQQIVQYVRAAAADGWLHLLTGDLTFSQRYAISQAPGRLEALAAENAALRDRLADVERERDEAERDKQACTSIIVQQRERFAAAEQRAASQEEK